MDDQLAEDLERTFDMILRRIDSLESTAQSRAEYFPDGPSTGIDAVKAGLAQAKADAKRETLERITEIIEMHRDS